MAKEELGLGVPIHYEYLCDGCKAYPFMGKRYHRTGSRSGYDLCSGCYKALASLVQGTWDEADLSSCDEDDDAEGHKLSSVKKFPTRPYKLRAYHLTQQRR